MKKEFSTSWNSSTQPRKQRKYRHNAPLHLKRKFLSANLSKDLRKKYNRRSLSLALGDKVKVMRGTYAGKEGAIEGLSTLNSTVYISKIETARRDGSKKKVAIQASNLQITELNLKDKLRVQKLSKTSKE